MLPIVGIIIVIVSVLTGFSMAGGHIHSLIHPSELVTIGGAALGAMVCSSPPKVLKDLMHGLITLLKGGNVGKQTYNQAFNFFPHTKIFQLEYYRCINGINSKKL